MSQSHLVIDFPIKGPANAKALAEELPPLMPEFANAQDDLGTVHFSRFMIKGDEKLLFLSDIDGENDQHIERLVESAGPVFDAIFQHVDDAPATPVANDPQKVIEWLKDHVREPLDTYFAYEDASVQDIKECARVAGFEGNTLQSPLLIYLSLRSHLPGFALKLVEGPGGGEGPRRVGSCWDGAFRQLGALRGQPLGLLHDLRRRLREIRPGLRGQDLVRLRCCSFHTSMARRLRRSKRTPRRSISGHWRTTIRPSGSTARIQDSEFKTSEPCWRIIASHHRPPSDSSGVTWSENQDPSGDTLVGTGE